MLLIGDHPRRSGTGDEWRISTSITIDTFSEFPVK